MGLASQFPPPDAPHFVSEGVPTARAAGGGNHENNVGELNYADISLRGPAARFDITALGSETPDGCRRCTSGN